MREIAKVLVSECARHPGKFFGDILVLVRVGRENLAIRSDAGGPGRRFRAGTGTGDANRQPNFGENDSSEKHAERAAQPLSRQRLSPHAKFFAMHGLRPQEFALRRIERDLVDQRHERKLSLPRYSLGAVLRQILIVLEATFQRRLRLPLYLLEGVGLVVRGVGTLLGEMGKSDEGMPFVWLDRIRAE